MRQRHRQRIRLAGYRAWRARDQAARLAVPPREADPSAGVECMVWHISGPGWAHVVRLLVPRDRGASRPRSDQYTVEIDGQIVAERMGISDVLALLRKHYLPRNLTREQRARLDPWERASARDDAHAREAQEMMG